MSTLFLDRKDLQLRYESQCLVLYEHNQRRGTVPLHLVERIVMQGQIQLDTRVLGALADKNIGVVMLTGRQQRNVAMLFGRPHNDTQRRVAQYACYVEETERVKLSRWLVLGKLRSQQRFLKIALTSRADLRLPLSTGITSLVGLIKQITSEQVFSIAQLRGLEGSGAAVYFKAYQTLFPDGLNFTARQRRPPPDPVNACLSLGYTLLHFDAVTACHVSGLDPFIGFFHEPAFGRESLACDFIEIARAKVDKLVWDLFRERKLRNENFAAEGGGVMLNKSGRACFYAEYEMCIKPIRRLLRRYGYALAQRFVKFNLEAV
ncbi:MAG: CRISPR-associated endonuclease Cas1 [Methylovulum sp.]|jgi:CRISPR-associated protein Cas1